MSHDNVTVFSLPTPVNRSVDQLVVRLDKITLNSKLDLLEHPTNHRIFDLNSLLEQHVFNDFTSFCHAVANTFDGPQILYLLIKFMKYDVRMAGQYTEWKNSEAKKLQKMEKNIGKLEAKNKKLNKDKERLRKKLDHSRQKLD